MSHIFGVSGVLTCSKIAIWTMVGFPNVRPPAPPASRDRSGPVPTLPKRRLTHDQKAQTTCLGGATPRRP
jgi:hypothetical protein